jgi:hypothetical protein
MLCKQVLNSVHPEWAASCTGKQGIGWARIILTKPTTQCLYSVLAKRSTTFLATLAQTVHVGSIAEYDVLTAKAYELRDPEAGLNGHEQECPVTTTCPGANIRCCQEGFDLS